MNKLVRSFGFAIKGLRYALATQQNFRIHCVAAVLAIGLGLALHVSNNDWQWIALCIMLVLLTELINTGIEALVDLVSPGYNELAGRVKDVCAAAVLLTAIFSLVTGLVIFVPKFISLF
ncbi:diacylglycerol kinase family protein [Mucilaginibacter pallidiroseus]|uniref:Diacylglycerol kinase family protein n=1 Tax=Mucilaginibacter pallidiroseus TaxID=2599295 RepID=A0A563UG90_9SPHI|nr:diacylglycerol kinase family protein [Mucilaginibacter pallidiroseus]TWR30361.1 diacylglycerol kinase family protein [Mucilaginibacter pallidiroseus]